MAFDAAAVRALLDAVVSHAQDLGVFDRVNYHEPKNAPGRGLSCSVWVQSIQAVPAASGLAAVSGRVTLNIRLYTSMLAEPQDDIDKLLLSAATTLLGEYSGNFTLGGTVRDIDLMQLNAQAGYLQQDGKVFRVIVITLPIVINDIWGEVA
jgi:hypothetical protein